MKKFYGKKFVATALAAIIAVSSISATVFADFRMKPMNYL